MCFAENLETTVEKTTYHPSNDLSRSQDLKTTTNITGYAAILARRLTTVAIRPTVCLSLYLSVRVRSVSVYNSKTKGHLRKLKTCKFFVIRLV